MKPRYHSRRKLQSLKENNLKVKRKIVLTVILKPLNPFLQEDIPKEKESTKVKFFEYVFLVKKLVTLEQGVQIEKTKKKRRIESIKERRISKTTRTSRIKARRPISWLNILIVVMMMKWFILL